VDDFFLFFFPAQIKYTALQGTLRFMMACSQRTLDYFMLLGIVARWINRLLAVVARCKGRSKMEYTVVSDTL
jgi:hypothetical protein